MLKLIPRPVRGVVNRFRRRRQARRMRADLFPRPCRIQEVSAQSGEFTPRGALVAFRIAYSHGLQLLLSAQGELECVGAAWLGWVAANGRLRLFADRILKRIVLKDLLQFLLRCESPGEKAAAAEAISKLWLAEEPSGRALAHLGMERAVAV